MISLKSKSFYSTYFHLLLMAYLRWAVNEIPKNEMNGGFLIAAHKKSVVDSTPRYDLTFRTHRTFRHGFLVRCWSERCSGSYCQAVIFLVIKDDWISEREGVWEWRSCYTAHARRNLPVKEYCYLRTFRGTWQPPSGITHALLFGCQKVPKGKVKTQKGKTS